MPQSLSSLAVPPVDIIATPKAVRPRANSASPVLSETLISAVLMTLMKHDRGLKDPRSLNASRLMQNPLGAAFARKVLRCKARDEGRTLVLFDESRNAAAGHFSCKPFGAVLCGAICFVASLANSRTIRLRLPSRLSPPPTTPRAPGGR